jgi:hypothetical protein
LGVNLAVLELDFVQVLVHKAAVMQVVDLGKVEVDMAVVDKVVADMVVDLDKVEVDKAADLDKVEVDMVVDLDKAVDLDKVVEDNRVADLDRVVVGMDFEDLTFFYNIWYLLI